MPSSTPTGFFASGENYSIELLTKHAHVRVWRRPDIDSAAGATNAGVMVEHLSKLIAQTLKSVLFDLREAPAIAGPRTVETMSSLMSACEKHGVRIAIVVSDDPMQVLQFRRLASTYAPTQGRVSSAIDAEGWVPSKV